MADKTSAQTFQADWQKTVAWAKSQKIAPSAYLPVYQLDSRRLLQYGTPMSQAERTRAVAAAAGLNYSTALPSDQNNPTDVLGNAKRNLTEIFTGLNPVSMVGSVFDTIKNTVEHPQELWKPVVDLAKISTPFAGAAGRQAAMQDFSKTVLGQNSIWSFVPGAVDAAHLYQGKVGLSYMASNPITSILDVLPLDKIPMAGLSKLDIGKDIAARAGVHVDELKEMSSPQLAWKILKNTDTSKEGLVHLPNGEVRIRRLTIGERGKAYMNSKGFGSEQAELTFHTTVHSQMATDEAIRVVAPALKALGDLSSESQQKVIRTVYEDHRPQIDIINDSHFSQAEKDALAKVYDWGNWNTRLKLQAMGSKGMQEVATPYGNELYLVRDGSSGAVLEQKRVSTQAALDQLDAASHVADALIQHMQMIDSGLNQQVTRIGLLRQNVNNYIKTSLKDLPESSSARGPLNEAIANQSAWHSDTNLEEYLGLDPHSVTVVQRQSLAGQREHGLAPNESIPFRGPRKKWTDNELAAWKDAVDHLPADATRTQIEKAANERLVALGQVTSKTIHAPVHYKTAQALSDIVKDGGLVDQMNRAYDDQDWVGLKTAADMINQKLSAKAFQSPDQAKALTQLRNMANGFKKFANLRLSMTKELDKQMARIKPIEDQVAAKQADFNEYALMHPPDVWRNALLDEYAKQMNQTEAGAKAMDATIEKLRGEGWGGRELQKLREDPRAILEMMALSAKSTYENAMLPNVDYAESIAVQRSAYETIANMRQEHPEAKPMYVPTVTPFDLRAGAGKEPFNVFIGVDHVPSVDSSFQRMFDHTSSVYDLQAAMLKETRQIMAQKYTEELLNNHVNGLTFDRADLEPLLRARSGVSVDAFAGPDREGNVTAWYTKQLSDLNLVAFDPKGLFGISLPKFEGKETYMDKDLLDGLTQSVNKFQLPTEDLLSKGTQVFRTSILGYSPRFTAHIALGGTMLLGLRSSPKFLSMLPNALRLVREGKLPDDLVSKMGLKDDSLPYGFKGNTSTQEGAESVKWLQATNHFHSLAGHSAGQLAREEQVAALMAKEGIARAAALARVIPDMNFRFTHFTTNMQRATAFLDGLAKASKKSSFYVDEWDEHSQSVVRAKYDMTPEAALDQAMQHVEKVMGDLRAMSPIERNFLIKAMPFWGWTKHVLKYVASYPMDHPYRALVLSQLSTQLSQDQATGLPLRTQLLFFLGTPDAQGNVSAVDMRALNPLRDTANYASVSGWISSINPLLTTIPSMIDPSLPEGQNVMYPNITYSSLYGTSQAGPAGDPLTAAEQIIPELSALDTALNLSGQYAYLQQSGQQGAFIKKIANALNFPWVPQQLNLRQMSASDELHRYQQAKTAASNAWTSGDFSLLQGYDYVPDPRNADYDITPQQLQAVYNQLAKTSGGLSPADVATELPSPAY